MTRGIKKLSIFIALLCIILIQVAFVSGKEANGNATTSNATVSNATENIIMPQYNSPDIELQTSYISDTLEAGKTYVYKVQVKNIDNKAITIEPRLSAGYPILYSAANVDTASDVASGNVAQETKKTQEAKSTQAPPTSVAAASDAMPKISADNGQALDNSDISIYAPETIKAGDTAYMVITVKVPEKAAGNYYSHIDMNVNGVENDQYNPQLSLSFTLQQPPTVPYLKTFSTTTDAPITIDVSADTYSSDMGTRVSPKIEDPSFDLGLTYNDRPVDLTLVKKVESGNIYIGNSYPPWPLVANGNYQNYGEHHVETYRANGAKGDYKLSILPKNTYSFGYSITAGNNT